MPKRTTRFRNPVARSPLMKKGGVHGQSKTGQRVKQRLHTNRAIDEWLQVVEEAKLEDKNGEPKLPIFLAVNKFTYL